MALGDGGGAVAVARVPQPGAAMMDEEPQVGRNVVVAGEEYSMDLLFRRRHSRPEPTGGTWYQFGPFGNGGRPRPKRLSPEEKVVARDKRQSGPRRRRGSVNLNRGRYEAYGPGKMHQRGQYIGVFGTRAEADAALDAWLEGRER